MKNANIGEPEPLFGSFPAARPNIAFASDLTWSFTFLLTPSPVEVDAHQAIRVLAKPRSVAMKRSIGHRRGRLSRVALPLRRQGSCGRKKEYIDIDDDQFSRCRVGEVGSATHARRKAVAIFPRDTPFSELVAKCSS
jgi:hypothetical protein